MGKNIFCVLCLVMCIVLAGCNSNDTNIEMDTSDNTAHLEWTKTSLTVEDLEHIENTLPPLSYTYETFDRESNMIVDSGAYEASEGEESALMIPEYTTMISREVVSSQIKDDMLYTTTKITLQDGSQFDVLYVNEPDTLFYRVISVENKSKATLYSNFVYAADID